RTRILQIAAHSDISGLPIIHWGTPSGRGRGTAAAAPTASAAPGTVRPLSLPGQGVRHSAPLLGGNLLHPGPPLGNVGRCHAELRTQQQQVVGSPEPR